MPNFVAIGQTDAEKNSDFSIFKMAAAILDFCKFEIFSGRNGQEGRTASPCQIWLKSVKTRPRYGNFSIFQDGGCRHVGFLVF